MRRLSEDQVAALVAEREAGAEINDLAARFGVDRTTVMAHLRRAGAGQRRRPGRRLSPDQVQAAGKLYESGVNLLEVASAFDVDRRYLRVVLPAAGFVLRASGRQAARPNGSAPSGAR